MTHKKTVVISLLGINLDAGLTTDRWSRWRPTVALSRYPDLLIDRLELLYQPKFGDIGHQVARDVQSLSPQTEVRHHPVDFDDPWDFETVYDTLYAFADSIDFDPENERYLVHITTGTHVAQICWFLLTEAREIPGELLQTAPPEQRGSDDLGHWRTIDLDLSRYDRIATRFAQKAADGVEFLKRGIPTRNVRFNQMMSEIEQVVVASTAPLLLTGPTGAGKTHLARRIYELKTQRHQVTGSLVEVNCATLRGDGAMSTLFGHKRGAFTGAASDREGLLRQADGGLLFLDEIGELGLDEQAMLLQALEEKRFMPMGADREVQSDFQLIAGTNRDLWRRVSEGSFREDLLARLSLWSWRLPGLRERTEDLEANLDYELARFAQSAGRRVTFNREGREQFLRRGRQVEAAWRGNFRDLNAAVTRMATLAPSGRIDVETVDREFTRLHHAWRELAGDRRVNTQEPDILVDLLGADVAAGLDRFDRVQLIDVVSVCRKSRSLSEAGRALFAESRKRKTSSNDADRLRKYLGRFELTWKRINPPPPSDLH